ncbi:MAG TPA: hypothetical protein VEE82_03460 [Thermodesulfovibrionales bacterium]|nr:hypothetical protein [Thermodesulfovibrionales bacterium]
MPILGLSGLPESGQWESSLGGKVVIKHSVKKGSVIKATFQLGVNQRR